MGIEVSTPGVDELGDVVRALADWQGDASPMQLHPGDLGWFGQFGAAATAAAIRIWTREQIVAIGFLDGPDVLRLTVAPDARQDETLAERLVSDVTDSVFSTGRAAVEAPNGTLVQQRLTDAGWDLGESWTPLHRDLDGPVESPDLRVEVVGIDQAAMYVDVHRSAWDSRRFTVELWRAMADGLPFADARCLLGYDDVGAAVAGVAVWSAGRGRPGLLEPMGVHADHRGRGHGRAICLAGAAALQEMGSSSALVCTPTAREPAIATYESAGFAPRSPRLDRTRGV